MLLADAWYLSWGWSLTVKGQEAGLPAQEPSQSRACAQPLPAAEPQLCLVGELCHMAMSCQEDELLVSWWSGT